MTKHEEKSPDGINRMVVFDTNAYRNLTFGLSLEETRSKVVELREKERAAGVMALANPMVIWELIGHLADKSDPAYYLCMNALVGLVEHTRTKDGGIGRIADGDTSVCRELFHIEPETATENSANLGKLANLVSEDAPDITGAVVLANLRTFANLHAAYKLQWITDMQSLLERCSPEYARAWLGGNNDPETRRRLREFLRGPGFIDAWAEQKVLSYAALVGVSLAKEQIKTCSEIMKKVFPTPFQLLAKNLRNWADGPDIDLSKKKRANFLWDAALCFTIGGFHAVGTASIFFVTEDDEIAKAAKAAGCGERVHKLKDYLLTIPESGF